MIVTVTCPECGMKQKVDSDKPSDAYLAYPCNESTCCAELIQQVQIAVRARCAEVARAADKLGHKAEATGGYGDALSKAYAAYTAARKALAGVRNLMEYQAERKLA
jgi:hypothetical protein